MNSLSRLFMRSRPFFADVIVKKLRSEKS